MWRRALDVTMQPADVLRALRGRPGLVGLVGAWCGGGAVVSCEPARVLGPDTDPFAVLMTGESGGEVTGFGGGWIGLWGYQLGRRLERLPAPPHRPRPQPDHWLGWYDWVLRQDHDGCWWFESLLPEDDAADALQRACAALDTASGTARDFGFGPFVMTPSPEQHMDAVARAIEHIRAGDIFQANVCARLEADFHGDPLDVFCRGVEHLEPAYAAFLDTGERAVASFSPELFLWRQGTRVRTAPIKGTVPLAAGAAALTASVKDRAENVMIVDLMRNDLGRVCRPGTISVPALARATRRAGVWHLVSEVTGTLREGHTDADLVRATFPPGSVTGAPKIRAMELINELESTGRELYTGMIGYAGPEAGLETSVVIRTLEFADGRAWLGVGGGVVADSTPAAELEECLTKARPVLAAVGARLAGGLAYRRNAAIRPTVRLEALPPDRTRGVRPDPLAGLFTTVLVEDGAPVLVIEHVERLASSAWAVYGLRLDADHVVEAVRKYADGVEGRHRLRITVTGAGDLDVAIEPVRDEGGKPRTLVPALVPGGLGGHKWLDRRVLDGLVPTGGADVEALLVDADGTLLETARANLFVVLDDGVHTPATDGRILPGVTRAAVIELLERHRIPVHDRDIGFAELSRATEVFTTSAIRGVTPVASCVDVARWGEGPTTSWLRSSLLRERQREQAPPKIGPRKHMSHARVLLIDNYDSFTYNLAQYAEELGASVSVVRNDERDPSDVLRAAGNGDVTHVVISPGPGRPEDAGISVDLIRRLDGRLPVLGVCLGHQSIATAYGARVTRGDVPVHGKQALVHHDGNGLFTGIYGPFVAARYHSLVVRDLTDDLELTAWTAGGTVMGVRHRRHPVEGIQVHPESILTPRGKALLRNFLASGRPDQFSNL